MVRFAGLVGGALTLFALVAVPSAAAEKPALASQLEPVLEAQRTANHIPGLAFIAVKDGKVLYAKAFGQRDIAGNQPVTLDTLFPIGSCSKAFTAMAAALAADDGKASLDDPPRKFLPWFKMADPETDAKVTLRDLLSHRTGLMAYADLASMGGRLTPEEYVQAAASAKPTAKMGEKFQYSNSMYAAAGLIVGKAYGAEWADVVKTRIFLPLGMRRSATSADEALKAADHTTGYVFDPEKNAWIVTPVSTNIKSLAPAGSIVSSANDMGKWVAMLADGGMAKGKPFVSDKMFTELTTPHIKAGPTMSYALGWVTYEINGHKVVEHNGGSTGLSALVSFIPGTRTGFVILANTSSTQLTKITFAGKLLWPIILGEPAVVAPPKPEVKPAAAVAPDPTLPSADALIAKVVTAMGGEKAMARHPNMVMVVDKKYLNQGVDADVTLHRSAPAKMEVIEAWRASGKQFGRVRIWFDGVKGAQETDIGQDEVFDADGNVNSLRDFTLYPWPVLKTLYQKLAVTGRTKVGDEEAFLLEMTPEKGTPVTLTIAAKTGLVLKRQSADGSEEMSDYRSVDGIVLPFHVVERTQLGEAVMDLRKVTFEASPPETFGPKK